MPLTFPCFPLKSPICNHTVAQFCSQLQPNHSPVYKSLHHLHFTPLQPPSILEEASCYRRRCWLCIIGGCIHSTDLSVLWIWSSQVLHCTEMGRHSCCYKQKLRKGLWSPEEDEKLMNHITKHGHGCWSSVPKLAGMYIDFFCTWSVSIKQLQILSFFFLCILLLPIATSNLYFSCLRNPCKTAQ